MSGTSGPSGPPTPAAPAEPGPARVLTAPPGPTTWASALVFDDADRILVVDHQLPDGDGEGEPLGVAYVFHAGPLTEEPVARLRSAGETGRAVRWPTPSQAAGRLPRQARCRMRAGVAALRDGSVAHLEAGVPHRGSPVGLRPGPKALTAASRRPSSPLTGSENLAEPLSCSPPRASRTTTTRCPRTCGPSSTDGCTPAHPRAPQRDGTRPRTLSFPTVKEPWWPGPWT